MIVNKKKLLLLSIIVFAPAINLFSQALPDSTTKKIDSLFTKWNNTGSPGCAVGIVRNDSLIFAKGYGMANLEYASPDYSGNNLSHGFHFQAVYSLLHYVIITARQA